MTSTDLEFAREHAAAYCGRSPSLFEHADDYGDWYIENYAIGALELSDLPDHPNVFPAFLRERELI